MAARRRRRGDEPAEAEVVDVPDDDGDEGEPRRCFVAVRPPEDVVEVLAARVDAASRHLPGVRWVDPEQWHVTIKFLGDIIDVHGVARVLRDLSQLEPFRVRLGGAGAFPTWTNARTVWAGVERGSERLARLSRSVDRLLDDPLAAGTLRRAMQRPFLPHLTLARAPQSVDARMFLARMGAEAHGEAFDVDSVTLFESQPGRGGRRYVPLAVAPLLGRFL